MCKICKNKQKQKTLKKKPNVNLYILMVLSLGIMQLICSCLVELTALRHHITHPLSGMVQHLLPGWVKVTLVFLHQPLFSKGDSLFGSPKHFSSSLEVLCCPLGLKLSLGTGQHDQSDTTSNMMPRHRADSCWGTSLPLGFSSHIPVCFFVS